MLLWEETFSSVTAFVGGYDIAVEGGLLVGFREWLILELGSGTNLGWPKLVLDLAFPDAKDSREALKTTPNGERIAIDTFFELFAKFEEARGCRRDGLKDIYVAYEKNYEKLISGRAAKVTST